jgi:PAS domain S-box-containing protein
VKKNSPDQFPAPAPRTETLLMSGPEARYSANLEATPDAVIMIDAAGMIAEWNPAAEQIFGYTRSLVIGQEALALLKPETTKASGQTALIQNLRSGLGRLIGKRTELTVLRANGSRFPIELTLTQGLAPGPPVVTARIHDITERKHTEDVLHRSAERFRLLVEGVDYYAIYLIDPHGRVLTWNAGSERLDGYRARDIIGRNFHRFYTTDDVALGKPELAMNIAAAKGRYISEDWSVRKDGSRYWASVVLTALRRSGGTLYGFSRIGCDHTQRKNAEIEAVWLTRNLESNLTPSAEKSPPAMGT